MNSLEYLDMVIHETIRMHPTVPILWRVCTKTYHTEVRGKPHTIYKGEEVHIPTYTIHHDPDYYPDPEKFDPKRFSKVFISFGFRLSFISMNHIYVVQ